MDRRAQGGVSALLRTNRVRPPGGGVGGIGGEAEEETARYGHGNDETQRVDDIMLWLDFSRGPGFH